MPNVIDLAGVADEGESSRLTATLYELSGSPLDAASIIELTMTLQNEANGAIINNRDQQSILNMNGGRLEPDGTVIVALSPEDNVIVINSGTQESHIATVEWSWIDDQGVQQYGLQKWRLRVAPSSVSDQPLTPGWVG